MPQDCLEELHDRLRVRFDSLFRSRSQNYPVYFIEHGLDSSGVEPLFNAVTWGLRATPCLSSDWWRPRFLPLLARASELGYRYRGNGTEYWPLMEKRFGATFDLESHTTLHKHFDDAAKCWRGCRPPVSGWADTFRHIGWPVTHAVLPRHLQRPFVESLRALRVQVESEQDDALHDQLLWTKPETGTSRYHSWLQNPEPAVSLTRRVLGGLAMDGPAALSQEIVEDIRRVPEVHQIYRQAKRQQRVVPVPTKRAKPARTTESDSPALPATLMLRIHDNQWRLEGQLPQLPVTLRKQLRSPLQGRWRPRPWGMSDADPIPRQAILLSSPFPLKYSLVKKASSEAPFLTELEQLELSSDETAVLQSVRFKLEVPLLFGVIGDDAAHQLLSSGSVRGPCYGLVPTDEPLPQTESVQRLSAIPGGQVLRTDLASDAVHAWLGIAPKRDGHAACEWRWLMPPSIATEPGVARYLPADPLALLAESADDILLRWSKDGQRKGELLLPSGNAASLPGDVPGTYVVELFSGEKRIDLREYEIVETDQRDREGGLCGAELIGDGPSHEEFPQQRLVKELLQELNA